MVLDDLALFLQTQGIGTLGTDLFKGGIPQDAPEILVQDALMALIEVPGLPPVHVHEGPSTAYEQPMIQVLTRGTPHSYAQPRIKANQAYLALDGLANVTLSGTFYLWVWAMQSPFFLRRDEMARPHLVFNIRCAKSRN